MNAVNRRGYILLLVLVLITLAGVSLAGLSRAGLSPRMQAAHAERELQNRWGALSCRAALADSAEDVLTAAQRPGHAPVGRVSATFSLAGNEYQVVIAD